MRPTALFLLAALSLAAPATEHQLDGAAPPLSYDYRVSTTRPHDRTLFTQGLFKRGSLFYESGGRYGQSRLVAYSEDNTGEPVREHELSERFFAEGATELDGRLYLLTWRKQTLLVFDAETFEPLGHHDYQGEGWGLTDNGEDLIRSDGSDKLFFHDAKDFSLKRELAVTENGEPVRRLNELEYIKGHIWANVWHKNRLLRIDPRTGHVTATLDLSALVEHARPDGPQAVLNGIAYDAKHNALWVTGKLWPEMFRLELSPSL